VITEVPDETPVMTPVVGLTVATDGVALLHVPPDGVLLSVVVDPTNTYVVPVMAVGKAFTVIAMAFDVAGLPLAQLRFEVSSQVIASPFTSVVVV
jgi:hypothetical protein